MKTRRESQRIIRRADSCGELDAAGTQTIPKVSGFVTAAGQVTGRDLSVAANLIEHDLQTQVRESRGREERTHRCFLLVYTNEIYMTDTMPAAAPRNQTPLTGTA